MLQLSAATAHPARVRAVRILVVAAAAAVAAACPPTPDVATTPHEITVRLRFKASCGQFSATSYDASCLAAVRVEAVDAEDDVVAQACQRFDGDRPSTLGDVIFSDDVAVVMGGLSDHATVAIRVLGMQDFGTDPCAPVDTKEALFWGQSRLVDVARIGADGGSNVVDVPIECRDCEQGCDAGTCRGCLVVENGYCPAERPLGFCVPEDGLCARLCGDDDDCFEGQMDCDEIAHRCRPFDAQGGLCTQCELNDAGVPEGCTPPYECLGATPTSRRGVCGAPCAEFAPCARGAKCVELLHGIFLVRQAPSILAVDAGQPDAG